MSGYLYQPDCPFFTMCLIFIWVQSLWGGKGTYQLSPAIRVTHARWNPLSLPTLDDCSLTQTPSPTVDHTDLCDEIITSRTWTDQSCSAGTKLKTYRKDRPVSFTAKIGPELISQRLSEKTTTHSLSCFTVILFTFIL